VTFLQSLSLMPRADLPYNRLILIRMRPIAGMSSTAAMSTLKPFNACVPATEQPPPPPEVAGAGAVGVVTEASLEYCELPIVLKARTRYSYETPPLVVESVKASVFEGAVAISV
jgi:hypothetical protein